MKKLHDVLDGLPNDRRQRIESRVKELIAEEAASYAKPLAAAVLLKTAVNESSNECGPDCDDHGHADDCPALSPSSWLEAQQREIDALKTRLAEAEGLLRGPIRYALTAPTDGWKGEVERNALDAIRAFLTPA